MARDDSRFILPGIENRRIRTERLTMRVLRRPAKDGTPVVFLHGNVSSSRFWEETLLALPGDFDALAPDLRAYGETEAVPVDATRGVRDFSDDVKSLAKALDLGEGGRRFHLAGWSVGGAVVMQYLIDHPEDLLSAILVAPMSPYGFGGTKDLGGTPCYDDYAGSGGGTANPDFVRSLEQGERGDQSPNTARSVMRQFYVRPPFRPDPQREEVYVDSMLSIQIGESFYPGDQVPSPNWPGVAPGTRGINNAISPRFCDLSPLGRVDSGPPVLWIHGSDDAIVSDHSFLDFGTLGEQGFVPGWPGADVYPPQPMVGQTRRVLEAYGRRSGPVREEVLPGVGHSPHVEAPERFRQLVVEFLRERGR